MKIFFASILVVILVFTAIIFIDHQREQDVYNFCKSHSKGNLIENVRLLAQSHELVIDENDSQTLLITKYSVIPKYQAFSCEIQYKNEKISQLSFIKQ